MTNSKLRNSDSACSICFSQVLLKLFTFLVNTADKEIYNIFDSIVIPLLLQYKPDRTNILQDAQFRILPITYILCYLILSSKPRKTRYFTVCGTLLYIVE